MRTDNFQHMYIVFRIVSRGRAETSCVEMKEKHVRKPKIINKPELILEES